jgi:hypothetical protein
LTAQSHGAYCPPFLDALGDRKNVNLFGGPGDEGKARVKRTIAIVGAVIAIASVSWIGIKEYWVRLEQRRHAIDCEHRNTEFARRVDALKREAHERLKLGTKKTTVSQFFTEHGIAFTISDSEASGILYTIGGCAPFGCGTDRVGIRVRVNVNADGDVTSELAVDSMYVDCV